MTDQLKPELTRYINSCLTKNEGEEDAVFDTDAILSIITDHTGQQDDTFRQRLSEYLENCWEEETIPNAQEILDLI